MIDNKGKKKKTILAEIKKTGRLFNCLTDCNYKV